MSDLVERYVDPLQLRRASAEGVLGAHDDDAREAVLLLRQADAGVELGIGLVVAFSGSLNYSEVFAKAPELAKLAFPGTSWMLEVSANGTRDSKPFQATHH